MMFRKGTTELLPPGGKYSFATRIFLIGQMTQVGNGGRSRISTIFIRRLSRTYGWRTLVTIHCPEGRIVFQFKDTKCVLVKNFR